MAPGRVYPAEARTYRDKQTGATIRQITTHPCINHHPFFFVPAYDNAMRYLFLVSYRTGRPEIFAEKRSSGELIQLTEHPQLKEWSIYPSRDGQWVYFTAGTGAWRVNTNTLAEEQLAEFGDMDMREKGMVGAAMGTTALSWCDRWWAVPYTVGEVSRFAIIDTQDHSCQIILERDSIGHPQFCPDDSSLLFYAGPLNDRVWVINRDGSHNRRLYARKEHEWITHETWIPGRRELAFVDWPNGIRCINVDSGTERRITSRSVWHAICNQEGTCMVADTNSPDRGLQLFDPTQIDSPHTTLCYPQASNMGDHWQGPFPYTDGPIKVYAPQHTHPHPSFSPDSRYVVFTTDHSGYAQVCEVVLPAP